MKKLYLLLTLFCFSIFNAQINDWDTALSQIYTPVSGFSSQKVLLNKITSFTDLYNYNSVDSNTSNADNFKQSLSELYRASSQQYFTNFSLYPNFENVASNASEIPIGIINTKCSYLNYDEENNTNGNLKIVDGKFIPINQSDIIFNEKEVCIISPLFPAFASETNDFTFRLDDQQLYQYGNTINQLDVDFGDGVWRNMINNSLLVNPSITVNINVIDVKTQKISFRVTQQSGKQLTTYATITLTKIVANNNLQLKSGVCAESPLLKHRSTIADATGVNGEIEYRTYFGDQNTSCDIRKPVIIVDGFDPGDLRRIEFIDCKNDKKCAYEGMTEANYTSISKLMNYKNNTKSLITDMNAQNFDVILVNFPYYNKTQNDTNSELICAGADDIIRNANTISSFIQKINGDLQTVGSTEKLVVVGPSMGGLITRYALAYLEKQGINTNTKLWVSMDSPHEGANIPLAIQGDIYFLGKILENEDAASKFDNLLHSKAAEQMLIDNINYDGEPVKNQSNVNFLSALKSNGVSNSEGYPILNGIKKIAITNGSLLGTKNVIPNEHFFDVKASVRIYFNSLFGPIRVGRKGVFQVKNNFTSDFNQNQLIDDNYGPNPANQSKSLDYLKKFFSYNSNGSMDAVPGGTNNSANDLKDQVLQNLQTQDASTSPIEIFPHHPIISTASNLIINLNVPADNSIISSQAFIPMHSALDTKGFSDWYQPINKNISCTGQTKFDSFYGENYNMEHVTFSENMVTWLMRSLTENQIQPPYFPLDTTQFYGSNYLCLNSTSVYGFADICDIPGSVTRSVTPNAQIISYTDVNANIKGITNGSATITATFQNGEVLSKTIWIGLPKFSVFPAPNNTNYVTFNLVSDDPNTSLEQQGLSPTQVVWKRLDNGLTKTGFSYFYAGPANSNWSFQVEIKATNSCGTFTTSATITPPPPPAGCNGYSVAATTSNKAAQTYKLIINPCLNQPQAKSEISLQNNIDVLHIMVTNIQGQIILNTTSSTFDLLNQLPGTYYVTIVKNGEIVHKQTLIKN